MENNNWYMEMNEASQRLFTTRWVPVSERLPEKIIHPDPKVEDLFDYCSERVLIYSDGFIDIGKYFFESKEWLLTWHYDSGDGHSNECSDSYDRYAKNVTHWMALPEKPE